MIDHEYEDLLDPMLLTLPLRLPLTPDLARQRIARFGGARDHEALHRLLEAAVGGLLTIYHAEERPLASLTIRLHDDDSATVVSHGPPVDTSVLASTEASLRRQLRGAVYPCSPQLCTLKNLSIRLEVTFASDAGWRHLRYEQGTLCSDAHAATAVESGDIMLTFWPNKAVFPRNRFDAQYIRAHAPSYPEDLDCILRMRRRWSGDDTPLPIRIDVADERRVLD